MGKAIINSKGALMKGLTKAFLAIVFVLSLVVVFNYTVKANSCYDFSINDYVPCDSGPQSCSDMTECHGDELYTYATTGYNSDYLCQYSETPTITKCELGCSDGACATNGEVLKCWLETENGEKFLEQKHVYSLTASKTAECALTCFSSGVFNRQACCSELGEYTFKAKTEVFSSSISYRGNYNSQSPATAFTVVCLHDNLWTASSTLDYRITNGPEFVCITPGYTCWQCNTTCTKYTKMINSTSVITSPGQNSEVNKDFQVTVKDTDNGDGVIACYYKTESNGIVTTNGTDGWEPRNCDSVFTVTVGRNGNCRHNGDKKCVVYVRSVGATTESIANKYVDYKRTLNVYFAYPTTTINSTENLQYKNFDLSAEDISGRNKPSQLACEFMVISNGTVTKSWSARTCNSLQKITVGPEATKYCKHQGADICTVCARSRDIEYDWYSDEVCETYSIDWSSPVSKIVYAIPNIQYQYTNFSILAYDEDRSGLSLPDQSTGIAKPKTCYYMVEDNGTTSREWTERTCGTVFNITIGTGLDCSTEGAGTCIVSIKATDWLGKESPVANISFGIGRQFMPPTVEIINPPSNSTQMYDFKINFSVSDNSGAGIAICYYKVLSNGAVTKQWTPYACEASNEITITVGTGKNCQSPGAGMCIVYINATDRSFNSFVKSLSYNIEFPRPISNITLPDSGSLQNRDFSVAVTDSATDGVDLYYCEYNVTSGWNGTGYIYSTGWKPRNCNNTFTVSVGPNKECRHRNEGNCTVSVRAVDVLENAGEISSRDFSIQFPGPESKITKPADATWQNFNFTVSITDADQSGSGLQICEYEVNDNGWQERPCNSPVNISVGPSGDCNELGNSKCVVKARAKDNFDMTGDIFTRYYNVDWSEPKSQIKLPVNNSWQTGDFNVTVEDTDNSGFGIDICEYKVENGRWTTRTCGLGETKSIFKVTVGETGNCNEEGGTVCMVCVRGRRTATGSTGTGDCRVYGIDTSGTIYPGISNNNAETTETGTKISGSATQTVYVPRFIACDGKASVQDCMDDYTLENQRCGEDRSCLCGSFTENKCEFKCNDKNDYTYMLVIGRNSAAKEVILKGDVIPYKCPVYNIDLLNNITTEFKKWNEELKVSAYQADYIIRNGGDALYWSEMYRRFNEASMLAENHINYMDLSMMNLSLTKSKEMFTKTDEARKKILEILSGSYTTSYLVIDRAVTKTEALNAIALIPIKINNTGKETRYGIVSCSFKNPQANSYTASSQCVWTNPGQQSAIVNITVDMAGEWTIDYCSARTAIESSCKTTYETDKKSDLGKFVVVPQAEISIEPSIQQQYFRLNTDARIFFTAQNTDINPQYAIANCRLVDPEGHFQVFSSSCSLILGASTQTFSLEFPASILGAWTIQTCEINASSNFMCSPSLPAVIRNNIGTIYVVAPTNISIVSVNIADDNISIGEYFTAQVGVINNREIPIKTYVNCSVIGPDNQLYNIISSTEVIESNGTKTFTPSMLVKKDGKWKIEKCAAYKIMSPATIEDTVDINRFFNVNARLSSRTIHIINNNITDMGGTTTIAAEVGGTDISSVEFSMSQSSFSCSDTPWNQMNMNVATGLYESPLDTTSMDDSTYYLCVRSTYNDGSKYFELLQGVRINNFDFIFEPKTTGGITKPGTSIIYYLTIKNTGFIADSFEMRPASQDNWKYSVIVDSRSINAFSLENDKSAGIIVNVTAPSDSSGKNHVFELTITGAAEGKSKISKITTLVAGLINNPPRIINIPQIEPVKVGDTVKIIAELNDPENDAITATACSDEFCTSKYCQMNYDNGKYTCQYRTSATGYYKYFIVANDSKSIAVSDAHYFGIYEQSFCTADSQCPTGFACSANSCIKGILECTSSKPCPGTKDKCYCSLGQCSACPSGYECSNFQCVIPQKTQCVALADCPGTDNACYCKNNKCTPCQDGYKCSSFKCEEVKKVQMNNFKFDINIAYIIAIGIIGFATAFFAYKKVVRGGHEEKPTKKQKIEEPDDYGKYIKKLIKKTSKEK